MRAFDICTLQPYLLLLFAAISSYAGPASHASIPDLTAKAESVVVGTATMNAASGTIWATIDVQRVLKGSLTSGSVITAQWIASGSVTGPIQGTHHGVFFLGRTGGSWQILPVASGDISWREAYIATPATISPDSTNTARDLSTNPTSLDRVLVELTAVLEGGAPLDWDLLPVFRQTRAPVLLATFRRLSGKADARVSALGIRGRLSAGDAGTVQLLLQRQSALAINPFWASIVEELRTWYLPDNIADINALGTLTANPHSRVELRIAAASALARLHSRETLPLLAQLLADQNSRLQALAVGGLAGFANNVPAGSHQPAAGDWKYRTKNTIDHSAFDEALVARDRSYYVGFWLQWWNDNRASILP